MGGAKLTGMQHMFAGRTETHSSQQPTPAGCKSRHVIPRSLHPRPTSSCSRWRASLAPLRSTQSTKASSKSCLTARARCGEGERGRGGSGGEEVVHTGEQPALLQCTMHARCGSLSCVGLWHGLDSSCPAPPAGFQTHRSPAMKASLLADST